MHVRRLLHDSCVILKNKPVFSEYGLTCISLTTLRRLIDKAEQQFILSDLYYGHGVDNALDEAAFLVLGALDIPFDVDPEQLNTGVSAAEQEHIRELIDIRIRLKKTCRIPAEQDLVCRLAPIRG